MTLNESYEEAGLGALKPHPKNPRQGDVGAIFQSIEVNGFYGAVVAQKSTGYILAGNHRYLAAKEAGMATIPVLWVDVDDERATKILLADNRTNDLASYNEAALAEILADLANTVGLEGTGYDGDDLDQLIADLAQDGRTGETEDEAIEATNALTKKWAVEPGQIWQIGAHRLMCGESTDKDSMTALLGGQTGFLVLTDPPYGISVVQSKKVGGGQWVDSHNYLPVANDGTTETAREFYRLALLHGALNCIIWGGNYFTDFLPPSRCWVIWDKQNSDNTFADAEMAWTSCKGSVRLMAWLWHGLCRKGDRATEGLRRIHPTQKPVGLHVQILEEFNPDKLLVVDGFLGSGTTMIAAEKCGMTCYGMEIEPGYVAVTLERMSKMGLTPILVEDGQSTRKAG